MVLMFYIFKQVFLFFLFIKSNVYDNGISEAEDEARCLLNGFKPPVIFHITDHSKAVLPIWFSVYACFGLYPHSFMVQIIFYFWSFEIME